MSNDLSVSIIIPNWNGAALLSRHLPAVLKTSRKSEVIVVDDGSTDDSVEILHNAFPTVTLIANSAHTGFSSCVNTGVRAARREIVVLLNTDVEPEKDFLEPLIPHFHASKVFAVGCMDKSYENGHVILRGRGLARWEKGFYVHERGEVDQTDTAWVSAGSGAFRRSIWNRLGGMDTIFNPFYWEDIDISFRAVKAGYTILFEPKSVVNHYHEIGKIKSGYSQGQIKRIAARNQFIFIWRNMGPFNKVCFHLFYLMIQVARCIIHLDLDYIVGLLLAIIKIPEIVTYRINNKI